MGQETPGTCQGCGKPFTPRRATQTHCRPACRQAAYFRRFVATHVQAALSLPEVVVGGTSPPPGQKNPHAVALGRLGGLKGGPARAAKLSAAQRSQIARAAAMERWAKKTPIEN